LELIDNVFGIDHYTIAKYYPVDQYFDHQQNQLGHIPYTEDFSAALGTMIVRKLRLLNSSPYKVIALDCDNTLWEGVVGEEGYEGIKLAPGHRSLQEFIVEQIKKGMLICLVSKNTENDVLEVFEHRDDMVLKLDQVISSRINWEPKSQNLISLAKELNLGLDSFIFIDDNPMECAEVSANCPGVLTLQLPKDPVSIPQFLQHIWAFDHLKATDEDRKRTKMYRENVQRNQYLKQTHTLEDFIRGLNLQVFINFYSPEHLSRISQLTPCSLRF